MSLRIRLLATALIVPVLIHVAAAFAIEEGEVKLPEPRLDGVVPVERALESRRSVREFAREPLSLAAASQLLWAAQGITDEKGLRTAPSAGALYPLEIYLVAGDVSGIRPGVYHYHPQGHHLSHVLDGDSRVRIAEAALDQKWIAQAPAVLVIAAVYERTARKYKRRTARYVHIEAGHAAQNVYLQAAALGLGTTIVGAFRDDELARAIGLEPDAKPIAVLPVGKPR